MTRKRFWEDPYLARLETRVAGVDGDELTLDETIFFAFSGGQESDQGTIAGHPVLEARQDGREIRYRLAPGHALRAGDAVTVEIDADRRYRLMRLHFAAELVLEIVTRRLPSAVKVGAHIAAGKARIDFRWPQSVAPLLESIRAEAAAIVAADRAIVTGFADREQERRYWEIDGFARVPCGGTHVRRSGEIGALALKRRNVGSGVERIEITLAAPD